MSLCPCVGHEDLTFFVQMNKLAVPTPEPSKELGPVSLSLCGSPGTDKCKEPAVSSSPQLLLCELGQHSLIHIGLFIHVVAPGSFLSCFKQQRVSQNLLVSLLGGREKKEGMEHERNHKSFVCCQERFSSFPLNAGFAPAGIGVKVCEKQHNFRS